MKKIVGVLGLCLIACGASAQIAVNLKNNAGGIYEAGTTTYVDSAIVQLIWSLSTNAQANANALGTNMDGNLGFGEYLLQSITTTSGKGGTWADQIFGPQVYANATVGGNAINSGYIFVRMFDSTAMGTGDYYLQQYLRGPNLTVYDSLSTSTIYDTNGSLGGNIAFDNSEFGHQVIPEPAVISLIGLFGGGLLVTKRLFNRT